MSTHMQDSFLICEVVIIVTEKDHNSYGDRGDIHGGGDLLHIVFFAYNKTEIYAYWDLVYHF